MENDLRRRQVCRTVGGRRKKNVWQFEPEIVPALSKEACMKCIGKWLYAALVPALTGFAAPVLAGVDVDLQIGQDGTSLHMIVIHDDEGFDFLGGDSIVL